MTEEYASDLVTWCYPEPYGCYDLVDADSGFFLDPANGYVALLDEGVLVGYRCFGADGRVPGGAYDESALDTGGGLRPSLTGKGLGRRAIRVGLAHGRERYRPPAFRVTVASFNERALRVVRSLGFVRTARFDSTTDGKSYEILVRAEPYRCGRESTHG